MAPRSFEFIAGSPALCLVDTLSQRGSANKELLNSTGDLAAWLRSAGLVMGSVAAISERQLRAARTLREAIYRSGLAVIAHRPLRSDDVRILNEIAARPPLRPRLIGRRLVQVGALPVEAAFSTLAADALHLFGTALRERVRACAGCQMMFLDNSRPGWRRWCSSVSGCGNRAKVRNLRARRKRSSNRRAAGERRTK